jgi:hypothetical protein
LKEYRDAFSLKGSGRSTVQLTPLFQLIVTDVGLLASRTVREHTLFILSHQECGILLQQPRKLIYA